MPGFGRFRNIFKRGPKEEKKEPSILRPPTEEDFKLSAELDEALEKAEKEETERKEKNAAHLTEQEELKDPRMAWSLIERVFKNRADLGETDVMDARIFRRKKGHIYFGAVRERERKTFDDRTITRDLTSVAGQQIEEGARESRESLRAQYMHERQSQRAAVVEHLMADMSHYIIGEDVEVKLTDPIDDRSAGTDAAILFKYKDGPKKGQIEQVLALDFTSAFEQPVIDKKIARSLRGVVRGYLNTIQYLRTTDNRGDDEFFSSRFVPRATIGVSHMSALLMAKQWEQRGKSGAPDIIGRERRASLLYAILEQYRGQRFCSEALDEEKKLTQPSDATRELKRAEARILAIIKESGLEWPGQKQHSDLTLERIRATVKSTGKSGKMPALLNTAKEDVARIDASKNRYIEPDSTI